MKIIFAVIKKELIDTLRDKRTLITSIVMPSLLFPLLIWGMIHIQKSLIEKGENKELKIGIINVPQVTLNYFEKDKYTFIKETSLVSASQKVADDSLDAIISFSHNFIQNLNEMKSSSANIYFKSTNLEIYERLSEKLKEYDSDILSERVKKLQLDKDIFKPINIFKRDVASKKERIGKIIGGFLPYLFIMFAYIGCLYPALDIITGEKEKGTIETLLTVPVSRLNLLIGKMLTIAIVGLSASIMIIIGILFSLKFIPEIPSDFLKTINDMLDLKFIIMLFIMLIPLTVFFSGLLISLVIRAKNFKEAQSITTPVNIVIFIPAIFATIPGIELDWQTVWIPILNLALATKEIMAGTIVIGQYLCVVTCLIVYAAIGILISYKQFSNENVVLK